MYLSVYDDRLEHKKWKMENWKLAWPFESLESLGYGYTYGWNGRWNLGN